MSLTFSYVDLLSPLNNVCAHHFHLQLSSHILNVSSDAPPHHIPPTNNGGQHHSHLVCTSLIVTHMYYSWTTHSLNTFLQHDWTCISPSNMLFKTHSHLACTLNTHYQHDTHPLTTLNEYVTCTHQTLNSQYNTNRPPND